MVFDPAPSFRQPSCLWFFLIFHFLARYCGSKPQPASASVPIENLNSEGMLALPLTPQIITVCSHQTRHHSIQSQRRFNRSMHSAMNRSLEEKVIVAVCDSRSSRSIPTSLPLPQQVKTCNGGYLGHGWWEWIGIKHSCWAKDVARQNSLRSCVPCVKMCLLVRTHGYCVFIPLKCVFW